MEKTQNSTRRLVGIASVALVLASLTACTGPDGLTAELTQSSSPSNTATAPATSSSAADPGQPFDLAEAKVWTDQTVAQMQAGTDEVFQGETGHLDAATSQNRRDTNLSLPGGGYSYYFACRGEGTIMFGITSGGVQSTTLSGPCDGVVQGGDFTTVDGGTDFRFTATGGPIDFVLRYGTRLAR